MGAMRGVWVAALVAAVAQAGVPAPVTQDAVGPTGTMYDGTNVALRVPSDGSMQAAAPAAGGSRIGGQEAGQSDTSAAGGGN